MGELSDWLDVWKGEVVYVVGSSAALDWFDPRRFDNERVIAINFVGPRFGLSQDALTVSQYYGTSLRLREMGWNGIVFEPDRCLSNQRQPPYEQDDRTVPIAFPDQVEWSELAYWRRDKGTLIQGGTSLHPALNLAAYVGVSTVVTVAADHGWWNENANAQVYADHIGRATDKLIPKWHRETISVAEKLREWGVAVHTLLPFVNLNCEGQSFRGPTANIWS